MGCIYLKLAQHGAFGNLRMENHGHQGWTEVWLVKELTEQNALLRDHSSVCLLRMHPYDYCLSAFVKKLGFPSYAVGGTNCGRRLD